MKKSLYVAFSNQKGGVGKSAFTTLVASYLHYAGGKNVAVVDCDHPQHSIHAMRERDKEMVGSNNFYKKMIADQFNIINKKAYPIVAAHPADAIKAANKLVDASGTPPDVVFFDLSGTVNSEGILHSMINLDYIFCPIITDRIVMQSSLSFVATMRHYSLHSPQIPLKGVFLFWNQLVRNENKKVYDASNAVIRDMKLDLLHTEIPFSVKYKREMMPDNRPVFRSTLFPADKLLIKGSNLDLLMDEICQIIKI